MPSDKNQKAILIQKVREESLKKLKKKAATFESEIQEFRHLIGNIKVKLGNILSCGKLAGILE